jgi:ABC-type sugar transport system ATPase subunit
MNDNILEISNLTKLFPGVIALDGVSFPIKRNTVHAICGENGAGKSTLISILSGVYKQDGGEILIEGKPVRFSSIGDARKLGVSVVFQELSIIQSLSVAENIFANNENIRKHGLIDWKRLWDSADELLQSFDIEGITAKTPVMQLSQANQQLIEIIKAISQKPKVLILDEPTSSLGDPETKILFRAIRRLKEQGCTIIYISHHLSEVFEICDEVSILRDGMHVCDAHIADIDEDWLIRNMVGRNIENVYGKSLIVINEGESPVLEVRNISSKGRFYDVSFHVRKGEIISLAGLVGAGRTEVCLGLFGAPEIDSGEIVYKGDTIRIKSPADAIDRGICYMTEDRKNYGLYLSSTIAENMVSNKLRKYSRRGFVNDRAASGEVDEYLKLFHVVCTGPGQEVATLSGGNQQKLLLAEWVSAKPDVIMIDEPTRGVDVGARSEIYSLLRDMAADGMAMIIVSSDLPEVLNISDRIIVMKNGTVAGEVSGDKATEEDVMHLAASS